jgi:hypothetical protein
MTSPSVVFSRQKEGGTAGAMTGNNVTGATDLMDEVDVEIGLHSNPPPATAPTANGSSYVAPGSTAIQMPSVVSKILSGYRQTMKNKSTEDELSTSNFLSSGNAARFSRTDDEPDDDGDDNNAHAQPSATTKSVLGASPSTTLGNNPPAKATYGKDALAEDDESNDHLSVGQKVDNNVKQVSFKHCC